MPPAVCRLGKIPFPGKQGLHFVKLTQAGTLPIQTLPTSSRSYSPSFSAAHEAQRTNPPEHTARWTQPEVLSRPGEGLASHVRSECTSSHERAPVPQPARDKDQCEGQCVSNKDKHHGTGACNHPEYSGKQAFWEPSRFSRRLAPGLVTRFGWFPTRVTSLGEHTRRRHSAGCPWTSPLPSCR